MEKRYNDGLIAITIVAEEDVQVVGKQTDQTKVILAKIAQICLRKKLVNLNYLAKYFYLNVGIWRDIQIFLKIFKIKAKGWQRNWSVYNNLCKQKEVEKPSTGLQDQEKGDGGYIFPELRQLLIKGKIETKLACRLLQNGLKLCNQTAATIQFSKRIKIIKLEVTTRWTTT